MKNKILFWGTPIICGLIMGLVIIPALVNSCSQYIAREKAKAEERQAEQDSLILTDAEMQIWTEVYSAAVRRGVWYPARVANSAIIELRKNREAQGDK